MRHFEITANPDGTLTVYVTTFDVAEPGFDPDYEEIGRYSREEMAKLRDAIDALLGGGRDELVEALDQLLDDMQEGHCVSPAAKQMAVAALAKARGGS